MEFKIQRALNKSINGFKSDIKTDCQAFRKLYTASFATNRGNQLKYLLKEENKNPSLRIVPKSLLPLLLADLSETDKIECDYRTKEEEEEETGEEVLADGQGINFSDENKRLKVQKQEIPTNSPFVKEITRSKKKDSNYLMNIYPGKDEISRADEISQSMMRVDMQASMTIAMHRSWKSFYPFIESRKIKQETANNGTEIEKKKNKAPPVIILDDEEPLTIKKPKVVRVNVVPEDGEDYPLFENMEWCILDSARMKFSKHFEPFDATAEKIQKEKSLLKLNSEVRVCLLLLYRKLFTQCYPIKENMLASLSMDGQTWKIERDAARLPLFVIIETEKATRKIVANLDLVKRIRKELVQHKETNQMLEEKLKPMSGDISGNGIVSTIFPFSKTSGLALRVFNALFPVKGK